MSDDRSEDERRPACPNPPTVANRGSFGQSGNEELASLILTDACFYRNGGSSKLRNLRE